MIYKPATVLIYHTVVLLFLLSLQGEISAESLSCGAVREQNTIINIRTSRANNNMTRAIQGLNFTDELSCRQKCCNNDACTVYVYYNSMQRQFNCFLIKCVPTSSCVRSSLDGSVVGVMERNSLVTVPSHTVSSVKSNQGVTLETSITQTPIVTSPTTMEQSTQQDASKPKNESKVSPTSMLSPVSHASNSSIPVAPHTTPPHSTATSNTTHPTSNTTHPTTKIQKETITNPSTEHDHTNNTSLVIALFFGILFLLAVILIVGRPWWEFIQRPRYSKVDYLMNGL